ncbi:MAG TPA: glycosyltransferase [Acidimicrobiales bacterium]|nr:glycosyltransferase [Acidimicrobiales bacterium]
MTDLKPQVSIIIPTRDEAECIEPLVERLAQSLRGIPSEIIFADDSSDHTPSIIEKVADSSVLPIVCLHRAAGERIGGLGGAVVAGLRLASGEVAIIMDGDLQHPPECIPNMVTELQGQAVDLIVGSRYSDGGHANGLSNRTRRSVSKGVTDVTRLLFPRRLRVVSDPMSGFFALKTAAIDIERLRPIGYKILLEIVLRNRGLRVGEVGFDFAPRFGGESKATMHEGFRFLAHIVRLRVATAIPFRRRTGTLQVAHA